MKTEDYSMFSKAGNRAVTSMVDKIRKRIDGAKKVTEDQILKLIRAGIEKVEQKHEEIFDTEPQYAIQDSINDCLRRNSYAFRISRWDF